MKKILLSLLLAISIIFMYPHISASAKIDNCSINPHKIKLEEKCKIAIGKLHPSQAKVGMYQVKYNLELLKLIDNNESSEYKSIREYLKDKVVPVVIGPNNIFYMVDRHHTMRGIWDYYQQDMDQKIYIKVIKNWSNKQNFWQEMKTNNYTYLGALAEEISPSQLPENIGGLTDDNYRSAVGLAIKWAFFEKPKGKEKYFYQFKWGNCLKKLNFNLPKKIDREDIYATAAFLYNQENKIKIKNTCNLNITDGDSWSKIIKVLEN